MLFLQPAAAVGLQIGDQAADGEWVFEPRAEGKSLSVCHPYYLWQLLARTGTLVDKVCPARFFPFFSWRRFLICWSEETVARHGKWELEEVLLNAQELDWETPLLLQWAANQMVTCLPGSREDSTGSEDLESPLRWLSTTAWAVDTAAWMKTWRTVFSQLRPPFLGVPRTNPLQRYWAEWISSVANYPLPLCLCLLIVRSQRMLTD